MKFNKSGNFARRAELLAPHSKIYEKGGASLFHLGMAEKVVRIPNVLLFKKPIVFLPSIILFAPVINIEVGNIWIVAPAPPRNR